MALLGGHFGGATAVALSTTIGSTRTDFKQIDIKAKQDNATPVYVGGSNVAAGTAWIELAPGEAYSLKPGGLSYPANSFFEIDPTQVYLVGTAAGDEAYVVCLL